MRSMTSNSSKLEALGKILLLEKAGGFQDRTVIGGLDGFIQRSAEELRPVLGDLGSYSSLEASERRHWAELVLARLADGAKAQASIGGVREPPIQTNAPRPPAQAKKRPSQNLALGDEVMWVKGVGPRNSAKLQRLGVEVVRDLVFLFPRRHNDFANICKVSQLRPGQEQTVLVTVWEASKTRLGSSQRESTQAVMGDDSGNIRVVWWNQPWLARQLSPGAQVFISGTAKVFKGQFVFESPEYEFLQDQQEFLHTGRLVPVYPLTEGIAQRTLRAIVKQALDACLSQVAEYLPDELRHRIGLMGLQRAIAQFHYPDSDADLKAAHRRLAFDELFLMQLAVLTRKRSWQEKGRGVPLAVDVELLDAFLKSLPFSLTNAQGRVLSEILEDLKEDRPMSRLLQGDVGSGKTVVAVAALLVATFNGCQGALMAPTEILAEQHFLTISRLLSGLSETSEADYLVSVQVGQRARPVTIGLLIGSLSRRAKDDVQQRIAQGEVDIVVGTQALIQTDVEIPRLALAVVDEQHRFGVMQRASLREKGKRPHLLAMSATPIPRSLALTLHGDLDLSVIDEMPPGRRQIKTRWVEAGNREAVYGFVRKQVQQGRQVFYVCPLIEESEAIQSRAAVEEYERLSTQVFPDLRLGLLHGRMALREKEQVMDEFQRGELDILVSTPVVEVGIDVPNATVMLIDGADRFGLAQLHQFRGRVGRGEHQSYCLLLADAPGEEARDRLKVVERTHDGFQLAEEDLRIRGPGDYLGTRQSGLPGLHVATLSDHDILTLARREAMRLLDADPDLSKPEHAGLAEHIRRYEAGLTDERS
jgi:ATP-dependent DNA helicase RecG